MIYVCTNAASKTISVTNPVWCLGIDREEVSSCGVSATNHTIKHRHVTHRQMHVTRSIVLVEKNVRNRISRLRLIKTYYKQRQCDSLNELRLQWYIHVVNSDWASHGFGRSLTYIININ